MFRKEKYILNKYYCLIICNIQQNTIEGNYLIKENNPIGMYYILIDYSNKLSKVPDRGCSFLEMRKAQLGIYQCMSPQTQ